MQRADGKQDKVQQADEVGHRDVTSPLTGNSKILLITYFQNLEEVS